MRKGPHAGPSSVLREDYFFFFAAFFLAPPFFFGAAFFFVAFLAMGSRFDPNV